MTRVLINPELLTWARKRAGLDAVVLAGRFPKLGEWEGGELQPTLRQLEDFARAVHVAVGYLFLSVPPDEPLPIPDFRTLAGREVTRPSPNLLDTIYLCQQRQDWFRDYARMHSLPALDIISSVTLQDVPVRVAETMRQRLALSIAECQQLPTWTDALRLLVAKAEEAESEAVGLRPAAALRGERHGDERCEDEAQKRARFHGRYCSVGRCRGRPAGLGARR